ncbi:MAG: NAD(P)-binding domain-containing protein [Ignavibacteriae bacterium]|nr:NAD(P)-binding domain-containing protein [Ignavibacteriota bacterium]MCB9208042.1 NAD(P)-binding domain-containing protein [Ignavibacteriales bacterium]MCB9258811.1 NAD(P)-binding domain-containing protein [Ignavibacteriales bacterium]
MEVLIENLLTGFAVIIFIGMVLFAYYKKHKTETTINKLKIDKAKEFGFHEPVSLHPVINEEICIGSGACVAACPEKDILGIVSGRGSLINASHCVGHGACFHACPVQAITLVMGTEKRGVELPHVSEDYETNIPGIYIAGELGGMGLIKNAVEQGTKAMENIIKVIPQNNKSQYDVIIIGAGPAGIAATLTAAKNNKKFLTLEQDSLGGTVFTFPRQKIVMTSPMDLPLHGKVKLFETSKSELLDLWNEVLVKNNISINEHEKVLEIVRYKDFLEVVTSQDKYTTSKILLSIGRRGSPRKLGVPGENSEKVAYRLLEPELIQNKKVMVVGGGDSAIESALLLAEDGTNQVTISYRSDSFSRLKPANFTKIQEASNKNRINIIFESNLLEIEETQVKVQLKNGSTIPIQNDLVYIFVGGELPNKFLEKIGIKITKKFGEAVLKH